MRKKTLLRGTLAFFLVLVKPVLWIGTLIHVSGGAPAEVRAESPLGVTEGKAERPTPPLNFEGDRTLPPRIYLPQQSPTPLEGLEGLRRVTHRSRPGDSLAKLLLRFGLSEREKQMWLRAIESHYPGKKLPSGRQLHFYFNRPDPSLRGTKGRESLKALEMELDDDWILAWEKGRKGIAFTRRERPYDVELKTAGGIIEKTLYEDGFRAGLAPALLSQFVDIFSWDIDLDREIQNGDSYRLLYEIKSRKGSKRKPLMHILAAEFVSAGQSNVAIYFEKENGKGGYYDLDGRSLARAFLRFPLEFTSISSYLSHSRFHPILKVDRPHNGMDFVARRGTPVRAIGDGRVVYAGWRKGGYGRMIEIRHDVTYASRYAHLQGVGKGVRKGIQVRKGQIIGYVGSSGLTTGPHLHFELYKDQQYVDPLNFEFPREDRIEPALRRAFEDLKQILLAQLEATPHS